MGECLVHFPSSKSYSFQLRENEESLTELEANIQKAMQVDEGMSMASSDVGGGLLELQYDPIAAALFSAGGDDGVEDHYEHDSIREAEISDENEVAGPSRLYEGISDSIQPPDTLNLISPMPMEEAGEEGSNDPQSVGVLHDDLALSDDDCGSDDEQEGQQMSLAESDPHSPLEHSQMHASGQLNAVSLVHYSRRHPSPSVNRNPFRIWR